MTDPSEALSSFQEALLLGEIDLRQGELDPSLHVYADSPNGTPRVTYVKLDGKTVTALVILALCDPIEGLHCFGIGYAVPELYQNRGLAKQAVYSAISEMQNGLARDAGVFTFYIEAIVATDNEASKRVAEQTIATSPVAVTDQVSGLPAFQYVRKITAPVVA